MSKAKAAYNAEQIAFDVGNMKRIAKLDTRKIDFSKMTDEELQNNQKIIYDFKFLETDEDRKYAKVKLQKKLKKANKYII